MAKKTEVDILTDEKVRSGGILAKLYFDIQDSDKEKLQPLLTNLINDRLLKERGIVYGFGKINDPISNNNIYITSGIVTVLFENLSSLVNITFNYAPAGIEIIKPEKEINLRIFDLQSMLLDISNVSITYSKYIMERVLKPQELEMVKKQLQNRAELGKKLQEKSKQTQDNEKNTPNDKS